jgi:glutamate dehydrogenase/leucine dehydrogenase
MRRAYDTVHEVAESKHVTMRQAAYSLAVSKVRRRPRCGVSTLDERSAG